MNESVQRLLDRLIFIRIAEDRKIRDPRELKEIAEIWRQEGRRKPLLAHLKDLFIEVNDDLNGDIFKPHVCETVDVDSTLLSSIIEGLYFPESRYRFDVIGVELLGSIYERYLGSTIRITAKRAVVEEKPEVRKAGGVYYTPRYIVDYIVKNTVGRLIEGKTPKQIEKLKFLDPACGSGSFLIGAYQYLLNYHLEYYRSRPKETKTISFDFYQRFSPEDFALPLRLKAKILKNNIFGVDIDPQAVEITMLSLYLKLLEGERNLPSKQALLPGLSSNIKCGNSLIGYDFFESPMLPYSPVLLKEENKEGSIIPLTLTLSRKGRGNSSISPPLTGGAGHPPEGWVGEGEVPFTPSPLWGEGQGEGELSDETKNRINPFDWTSKSGGFGDIMNPSQSLLSPPLQRGDKGGFDVVIGNPPYVRQEMLGEFKPYLQTHYKTYHGVADLYVYFIEKGVSLLKEGGLFSYIVANKWLRANYGEPLRRWLKAQAIEEIVDFGDLPVFQQATTYPCILRVRKGAQGKNPFFAANVKTLNFNDLGRHVEENREKILFKTLDAEGWALAGAEEGALISKIKSAGAPLGEYVEGKIYYGIKTGLNEAFVIDSETRRRLIAQDPKGKELFKPFLAGRDIKRYCIKDEGHFLILIPKGWTDKNSAKAYDKWKWFSQNYSAIAGHLLPFKAKAEKRYDKGEYWWELRACDYYEEFERPKIIIPAIVKSASYTFDNQGYYSNDKTTIIPTEDKYLLGILNSRLVDFFMHSISSTKQGGYYEYKPMYVSKLPIRAIDFKNPKDKAVHAQIVSLVDRLLALHKKKNSLPPSAGREQVEREIAVTDERLDEIVYGLYGITEGERKLIEGK